MEHCAQFRLPSYMKDVVKLEIAQNKFSRMLPGLEARVTMRGWNYISGSKVVTSEFIKS